MKTMIMQKYGGTHRVGVSVSHLPFLFFVLFFYKQRVLRYFDTG